MENYIVSARKYRPSTFSSVIGQKALTSTLKNAIATDRLAHAYLFCGSRGVGKTSCARIFAKTINCSNPTSDGEACNECESCRDFNENRSLNIIELDAASNNGVDDIRNLVEQVLVPPTLGRYRVFIIDEVHMLSSSAFNAFLKTLEEPPSYAVFILATTEKQKIIPTILSRCQIYDFNRITISDIVDHLEYVASQEGYTAERSALNVIATKADGAMRDALSIFDQVAASSRGNITYALTIENLNVLDEAYYNRLMEAFIAGDVSEALLIYKEIRDNGFDSHFFINGLAAYLRDLMVARDQRTLSLLNADTEVKNRMAAIAVKCPIDFYFKAMNLCNEADLNYRNASSKTFLVELLLIKLCQLQSPSHNSGDNGEGQLKPVAKKETTTTTAPSSHSAAQTRQASADTPVNPAPKAAPAPVSVAPPPPVAEPKMPPRGVAGAKVLRPTHATPLSTKQTAPKTVETQQPSNRAGRYSEQQAKDAWQAIARSLTTEHILSNTMRACTPDVTGGDTWSLTVENDIQVEMLNSAMPRILTAVHDALQNDMIKISISVSTAISPMARNDREIFHHMVEQSPQLASFIDKLQLTLD